MSKLAHSHQPTIDLIESMKDDIRSDIELRYGTPKQEICDQCGKPCPVTFYVKGPVQGKLVCIDCKPSKLR